MLLQDGKHALRLQPARTGHLLEDPPHGRHGVVELHGADCRVRPRLGLRLRVRLRLRLRPRLSLRVRLRLRPRLGARARV